MVDFSNLFFRGREIDERMFGGNFVFSQDRLDGTFPLRAEQAGLEVIRFPGGHTTEVFFDPANPEAESVTFVNDIGETVTLTLVRLSDFIEYARLRELGAIIVLPVQRYLNAWREDVSGRPEILTAEDIDALRSYMETVMASGVPIHAIEIGNEPCLCGVNDEDYGKIVNEMSLVVHDTISDFEASAELPPGYVHPVLSLVATPYFYTADTDGDGIATFEESLMERFLQLSPEALAHVEAITLHRYVSGDYNSIDNFQAPWLRANQAVELSGRDLDVIVTEWNISATQRGVFRWADATEQERDSIDTGLKHAGAVAAMFHEMAVNDVAMAAFWAVQQQNDVGFALREGTTSDLRAGGHMFAYLSDNVQGMRAIEMLRPSPNFDMHSFADDDTQFIVINSRLGETQSVELDMTELSGPVSGGWVHVLTAAEGQDPRDPNVETVIEQIPLEDVLVDGRLTLSLDPWEIAVLSLEAGGDEIVADGSATSLFGGNGEDLMLGSFRSETFHGGLHDDVIRAGGGRDTLLGGEGNDTLFGNWANDRLEGGIGGDALYGQRGADTLFGDAGDDLLDGGLLRDYLYGGDGDDTLVGGRGHDFFWGGEGADVFRIRNGDHAWREPVHDFNPAEDRVELLFEDLSFDDIFLTQEDSAVVVSYGVGSLALLETEAEDLTEDHFAFL